MPGKHACVMSFLQLYRSNLLPDMPGAVLASAGLDINRGGANKFCMKAHIATSFKRLPCNPMFLQGPLLCPWPYAPQRPRCQRAAAQRACAGRLSLCLGAGRGLSRGTGLPCSGLADAANTGSVTATGAYAAVASGVPTTCNLLRLNRPMVCLQPIEG